MKVTDARTRCTRAPGLACAHHTGAGGASPAEPIQLAGPPVRPAQPDMPGQTQRLTPTEAGRDLETQPAAHQHSAPRPSDACPSLSTTAQPAAALQMAAQIKARMATQPAMNDGGKAKITVSGKTEAVKGGGCC